MGDSHILASGDDGANATNAAWVNIALKWLKRDQKADGTKRERKVSRKKTYKWSYTLDAILRKRTGKSLLHRVV